MHLRIISGEGQSDGPAVSESLALGRAVLSHVTDNNGRVLFRSFAMLDDILTRHLRFDRLGRSPIHTGQQIYYFRDNVLVRLKTHGTAQRPGAHLTVSLVQGGIGWQQERAKFTQGGGVTAATLKSSAAAAATPPERRPALTRVWADLASAQQDQWADRCHFMCDPDFDTAGAASVEMME